MTRPHRELERPSIRRPDRSAQPVDVRGDRSPPGLVLALQRRVGNAAVAAMVGGRRRAVSRYVEIQPADQSEAEWPAGAPIRVAYDGSMAVQQDSAKGSQRLWASPARIAESNALLAAKGSGIGLKEGAGGLSGTPPEYAALGMPKSVDLVSVEPFAVATGPASTMDLWADCRMAAREIMGVGATTANDGKVTGAWMHNGQPFVTDAGEPVAMADEILRATLGNGIPGINTAWAWSNYLALEPAKRDAFDREHGINRYVSPDVGEAFALGEHQGLDPIELTAGVAYFHWAGVIMANGADRVTLENFAILDPSRGNAKNRDWTFQLYGDASAGGQTFHEQHPLPGAEHTTVEATPR